MPWQADIHYLAEMLPRVHKNLYFQVSESEFQAAAACLEAAAPDLTSDHIKVELARLVAMVGDAHTNVRLTGQVGFRTYPLEACWFPEGLFVTYAGTGLEQALGCRITRIRSASTDDVYSAVVPLISHGNEACARATSPYYMLTPEILGALGFVDDPDLPERFSLSPPDGREFELEVPPVERDPLTGVRWATALPNSPLYRRYPPNVENAFVYLPESRTAYLKYNVLLGDNAGLDNAAPNTGHARHAAG